MSRADTKRKVEKGGVFEKFEKQITGVEENTDNDLIYAFLDYVLSDNRYREKFNETKDKHEWWQMIQLLPTSYNQKRTVTMNYENVINIIKQRKNHKLDEWDHLIYHLLTLPYMKQLSE